MLKKSLLLLVISYSLFVGAAHAATPTPEDKIRELRDQLITNIASRVAQLKLVEKRGIIGKVISVTSTQITVADVHGVTRFVDVDELTKFSSPASKAAYGISDIAKDSGTISYEILTGISRRVKRVYFQE